MTYSIPISWQSSTILIPNIQHHVVEVILHDVGVFDPQERAVERGVLSQKHQALPPISDPNHRKSDHTHLTSFTNHQHHSIRAHSSRKNIVWSSLWKWTQLVCQDTYLNSCSKFPDLLRLLFVFLCVFYYLPTCIRFPIAAPGNTLRHPQSL